MVSVRQCYFIGLNAIRALSVIGLLLVFSSSIFVMVNDIRAVNHYMAVRGTEEASHLEVCEYIADSTVPNQAAGVFWAVLNRLLIIFQVIILLLSELSWNSMERFFDVYFPVLGSAFGLGALGVFECLIGATILSHHVDDFTLVAAFFLFSIGCLNSLLGLVFRERAKGYRSIRAFRAAAKGVLPTHVDSRPTFSRATSAASHYTDEKTGVHTWDSAETHAAGAPPRSEWAGYGFGRQGEKAAGLRGFIISKPVEAVPPYAARPSSVASSSTRGRSQAHSQHTASREASVERVAPPTFNSSRTAL